jgi:hypothetical protein
MGSPRSLRRIFFRAMFFAVALASLPSFTFAETLT